jgi:hypothetical protein
MSRTDVHAPGWAKGRDPAWRNHFVGVHDHRYGPCDLAVFLTARGWVQTRCSTRYVGGRNIYCGCNMCTGGSWRRADRRRARHTWSRARRDGLKTADWDHVGR